LGLMLQRIHLPLDQKEHMPPKQKPQLTDEEIEIITQWVRKGSDFQLRVADLQPTDTLYLIAQAKFAAPEYDFPEPDANVVSKLNTVNRVVNFESKGSPALAVNFFNSSLFNSAQLNELKEIKKQIVSLNLAQMPLKDEDMKTISEFENLRYLNLSFTGINDVSALAKLKFLQNLSLSGTKVTASQLQGFSKLKTVYVWNTPITKADIEKFPNIHFEMGSQGDTSVLKLSPPVALNEENFITDTPIVLKLKHYIQGAVIHYTTDGTQPDSIHAAVFKGNERLDSNVTIRAKAYKTGWISSDVMEVSFLKNTFTPDSVIYLTKPNEKYQDQQGRTLINHEKGENDFRFGGWVAFRGNKMECLLPFSKPVAVQSIGLSSMVDVGAYIMPPALVEVWGGDDPKHLKLLGQLRPQQPGKVMPPVKKNFECRFMPASVSYVKIVAVPIVKLPSWHPGKGDKAWFFIDEIMVN
ncbi:MAG TPA: FN3 associated domain-containing protein, partial [Chitinophagaceae bacterium]|nr:FN3 associated domain-containing protein [Chitinophagaceae bacterium]